ncbi:hypothetical protein [Bradyrhizobium sp. AZCC 2289]|uniref:hypothetical protein n=1 Tax=Bradyrhizobium sp. AZCC 2289 TaxID=3117026 RepID=UPI002FEF3ABA
MIYTVKNSPEHMRQAVYGLARYKLQKQFTHADAKDIQRAQQALEKAIRGVEAFSRQQIDIPPPSPAPLLGDGSVSGSFPAADPALRLGSDSRRDKLTRRRPSNPRSVIPNGRSSSAPPQCSSFSVGCLW